MALEDIEAIEEFRPDARHPVALGIEAGGSPSRVSLSRGGTDGFLLVRARAPMRVRHQVIRRAVADSAVIGLSGLDRAICEIRAGRRRDVGQD